EFDKVRELDGAEAGDAEAGELLAAVVAEVLAVPGGGVSQGLDLLLQGLPAVESVKWALVDEGKSGMIFRSAIADDDMTKTSKTSQPSANQNLLKPADFTAQDFTKRLWGGYSRYALPALEEIKHDFTASKTERVRASWNLSRWYYAEGDYHKCLDNIKLIHVLYFKIQPVHLLAEIQCLIKLNLISRAENSLEFAIRIKGEHADFLILKAQVKRIVALQKGRESEATTLPLYYINKIYERQGLSPLVLKDSSLPLSLSNITAHAEPKIKNQKLKVSVIMPAYNAAETIHIALDSLLAQTWKNLEVIVVDDFSSDNTRELVAGYVERDHRVKLISKDVNEGCYPTRNRGLASATGDLIMVNDSDDWSHPQKIEYQIDAMNCHDCVAVMSYFVGINEDFTHFGNWRPGSILGLNHSSLMFKKEVADQLGGWDHVRVSADSEFVFRIEKFYGAKSIHKMKEQLILSLGMSREDSLTSTKATHLRTLGFGLRWHYRDAYKYWHSHRNFHDSPNLSGGVRKFPVPLGIAASKLETNLYDLVVVSDFSANNPNFSLFENYMIAACQSKMKVGAIHWRSYDLDPSQGLRSGFYEVCNQYGVDIITVGDKIDAKIVLVVCPTIIQYMTDGFPSINTTHLIVIVSQLAANCADGSGCRYDPYIVRANLSSLFGKEGYWIPISLRVKQRMSQDKSYPKPHQNPWYPTLNIEQFCSQKLRWRGRTRKKPIVGCCVQGHHLQWLGELTGLNQVDNNEVPPWEVRVLWHDLITDWLEEQPNNWQVIDSDRVSIQEFLQDLDFFIHYPHEDNIEELSYKVFEAMAVGIPVILPDKYQFPDTFGKAALYARSEKVSSIIQNLWFNESEYMQQAKIGRYFVENNCSFRFFVDRLNDLMD
ncbi:glycosyltransferase, partial [Limnospira platensis]|uniref:glycosyltransferase n=1 Tax=Limnospira platensis TaxID=118562 RepID=UPI003D6DADCA